MAEKKKVSFEHQDWLLEKQQIRRSCIISEDF